MKYETYTTYRDKAKMTDYKVAKETKVATTTLYAWGKGEYTPKMEKQIAIADLLKIPNEKLKEMDKK